MLLKKSLPLPVKTWNWNALLLEPTHRLSSSGWPMARRSRAAMPKTTKDKGKETIGLGPHFRSLLCPFPKKTMELPLVASQHTPHLMSLYLPKNLWPSIVSAISFCHLLLRFFWGELLDEILCLRENFCKVQFGKKPLWFSILMLLANPFDVMVPLPLALSERYCRTNSKSSALFFWENVQKVLSKVSLPSNLTAIFISLSNKVCKHFSQFLSDVFTTIAEYFLAVQDIFAFSQKSACHNTMVVIFCFPFSRPTNCQSRNVSTRKSWGRKGCRDPQMQSGLQSTCRHFVEERRPQWYFQSRRRNCLQSRHKTHCRTLQLYCRKPAWNEQTRLRRIERQM